MVFKGNTSLISFDFILGHVTSDRRKQKSKQSIFPWWMPCRCIEASFPETYANHCLMLCLYHKYTRYIIIHVLHKSVTSVNACVLSSIHADKPSHLPHNSLLPGAPPPISKPYEGWSLTSRCHKLWGDWMPWLGERLTPSEPEANQCHPLEQNYWIIDDGCPVKISRCSLWGRKGFTTTKISMKERRNAQQRPSSVSINTWF